MQSLQQAPLGSVKVRNGKSDGCDFYIGGFADSKCVSIMLNSWATTRREGPAKKRRVGGSLFDVEYTEYQKWYYYARHAVDDNNNNRQGSLSFEEAFGCKDWGMRQFAFIAALAQVNALLAYNYFVRHKIQGNKPLSKAEFTRMLCKEMLENQLAQTEAEPNQNNNREAGHALKKIPTGHLKWNGEQYPKSKQPYQKYPCSTSGCKAWVRTYCACNPRISLCTLCYAQHIKNLV